MNLTVQERAILAARQILSQSGMGKELWEKMVVWEKANSVFSAQPSVWRQDSWGNWINWYDYGNRHSHFGWEKDHIIPKSKGGSDELYNLRPLQWQNNLRRQAELI